MQAERLVISCGGWHIELHWRFTTKCVQFIGHRNVVSCVCVWKRQDVWQAEFSGSIKKESDKFKTRSEVKWSEVKWRTCDFSEVIRQLLSESVEVFWDVMFGG
jgi:hypothetical protein